MVEKISHADNEENIKLLQNNAAWNKEKINRKYGKLWERQDQKGRVKTEHVTFEKGKF